MIPKQCHLWQKEKITSDDFDFETIEIIIESSHFDRLILRCKQCGQLYFYECVEFVDWAGGNDDSYEKYIPVEEKDIPELKKKDSLDLFSLIPHIQRNNGKISWVKE